MIEHLTKEAFDKKVKGFNGNPEFKFEGEKPIIIDFYAPWCGPCKVLLPTLEQIKKEYGDTVEIYKVNTDEEIDMAKLFGIRGVPSMFFFPVGEKIINKVGAIPKPAIESILKENFKIEKNYEIN